MEMPYEQTSVYINLNGNQVLSALCRTSGGEWIRSSIDLNTVLGNHNGTFAWGGSNFGSSAKNITLQSGKLLLAELKCEDGNWTPSPVSVDLTEHITNHDGVLRRSDGADVAMIAPDVREKLDAVGGLIRGQQATVENAGFELECIAAANQRLVLMEMEVAFLRLRSFVGCIKGEFDEGDEGREEPEKVLRPIIRAFEKVLVKTDKALGLVEGIFDLTTEYQNNCIQSLKQDIDSILTEITVEVSDTKLSLDDIQQKIAESTAAIEENQLALAEAKVAKEKANSMETLIKLSGWVILPIALGMNITKVDGPFWDAIKGTEQRIKHHEDIHLTQQATLDSLTKQKTDFHATLTAHDALSAQLTYLSATITDLQARAESTRGSIGAVKRMASRMVDMVRELEDKGAMTDVKVGKKDYAGFVVWVLDVALPWFVAVGDVEGVLVNLEKGDDEKASVKEGLGNEIAMVRRKLELVSMLG